MIYLVDNIDITDYVQNNFSKIEERSFEPRLTFNNRCQIKVKNVNKLFSINNAGSIFYNTSYLWKSVLIYDDNNNLIYSGVINKIVRDYFSNIVTIDSTNEIEKYLKQKVVYNSADWETPLNALLNVFTSVSFTGYNSASIRQGSAIQSTNGLYCKVNIAADDNITLNDFIGKIAEASCAEMYIKDNQLFTQQFNIDTIFDPKITINESDILESLVIDDMNENIINEYRINYYNDLGSPILDTTGNNIGLISRTKFGQRDLKELRFDSESPIILRDIAAAKYLGECYIKKTNLEYGTICYSPLVITFSISGDWSEIITVDSKVKINFSLENWVGKKFEIRYTKLDYDRNIIEVKATEFV